MQRATKANRLASYEDRLLIDICEASEFLGLKVSRLRTAVFRGEIPYRKIGGLVRFVPSELRGWVTSSTNGLSRISANG
jgi:excisionase family DNA binding protein